jgi:hypothetical protein
MPLQQQEHETGHKQRLQSTAASIVATNMRRVEAAAPTPSNLQISPWIAMGYRYALARSRHIGLIPAEGDIELRLTREQLNWPVAAAGSGSQKRLFRQCRRRLEAERALG